MTIKRFKSIYVEIECPLSERHKIEEFYNSNPGFYSIYAGPKPLDFPKLDMNIKLIKGYITEEVGTQEII